jgi:hypothetical protein
LIKVLSKSMDSSLTVEKVELATVTRDDASGKVGQQLRQHLLLLLQCKCSVLLSCRCWQNNDSCCFCMLLLR